MEKLNRICYVCSTKYSYCISCKQHSDAPQWKSMFDKETCKDVFYIVSDYLQNAITKEQAIERLNECDLSNKDSYKEKIKNTIDELLSSNKTETTVLDIVEETPVEDIIETPIVEIPNIPDVEEISDAEYPKKKRNNRKYTKIISDDETINI